MEEKNELMVTENEEVEEAKTHSGLNAGLAMLIGSGLTLAAIAGGKQLKKIWTNHKLKKERAAACDFEDGCVEVADSENCI